MSNRVIAILFVCVLAAGLVGLVLPGPLSAQTQVGKVTLSSTPGGRDPWGVWSGNALVTVENHSSSAPVIHVYDQSGNELQQVNLRIPDAQLINIYNNAVARSADGYCGYRLCLYRQ